MKWVVSAEFHIRSAGSLLQTGLSHFERVLLFTNRPFQGVNEHFSLVDFLESLRKREEICGDVDCLKIAFNPAVLDLVTRRLQSWKSLNVGKNY